MKHLTLLVFIFLFQTKCLSSPIPKDRESVFSYHANIDVRNSASNQDLARWALSGKLRAQHVNGSLVIKLDDLTTSLFNGPQENINLAHEKEIPEESKVLMEPFIIHQDDNGQMTLIVDPNEPGWSINMKRGIASNFQIDTDIKSAKFNKTESSVHGECEVLYKVLPSTKIEEKIQKVIDFEHCSNKPVVHYGNVRSKPAPGFDSLKMKTVKSYTMRENNGVSQIHNIDSISQFTYQSMSKSPSKQHIDQYQKLDLLEMKIIEESIDTSKLTLKKDIIYEHEDRDYDKENQYEVDINQLKEQFVSNYDKFINKMTTLPLQNHDVNEGDYMAEMFDSLRKLPRKSLQQLEDQFNQQYNQPELYVFWSLLPYVGSEHAVDFIVNYNFSVKQPELDVNEQVMSKALATFPTYIDFPLDDKIRNYEILLVIDYYQNVPTANVAKLSFANIVANGYKKNLLSKINAEKYANIFHEKFLDNTENYEDRMTYLLGLVNMVEFVSIDNMLEIVTNKTENSNLRALALVGFKNHLKNYPTKMFDIFWSLVQNSEESLNMRIRSLDLILSMELSQEQFNIILKAFLGKSKNFYDKHITNYFISTLRSMKNEPFSTLKSYADAALQDNSFPDYSRFWTTGNYLISYNDKESNFGSSLQAQLIGDPETNSLDVLHFTYNHYAMSLDMGTYELYLKIKGIPESLYLKELNCIQQETTSVPELLDIIKKFQFKIKNLKVDAHIEIVVFVDGAAVYAFYDNMDGGRKLENALEYEFTSFFMEVPIQIWYPVMDYTYIPSDLGTELSILHDMQDIRMKNRTNTRRTITDMQYRSSWNLQHVVQSHNPVISAITRSYKYFNDEKSFKINSFNFTTIILDRKNDSLNWVWDKVMGTEVLNLQALREYCPKCERVNEIEIENKENEITDAEYLGMKFNNTVWQLDKYYSEKLAKEFFSTHLSNSATVPNMKPVLIILHYSHFSYYFKEELSKGNVRTIDFYDTPGNVSLQLKLEKRGSNSTCLMFYDFDAITNPLKNYEWLFNISANNIEPDHSSSIWNANFSWKFLPRHKENDNSNFKLIQSLNFEYFPQDSSPIITNVKRDVLLPDMNPNFFSLERPKPATTTINVTYGHIEDPNVYLLYETYSVTDEQMKKAKEMKEYEECKKDSKGLEFVPPTHPCFIVFAAISEYTHHKLDLQNASDTKLVRLFDTFRFDKNKIRAIQPYRLADPTVMAYHNTDVILGMKRKCIITPKQISTFTAKSIPFDEEKSAVLIECFNSSSLHGVMVDKLNDKNIGFKYISYENTITATVLDNKLIVKLNDTEIHGDTIYEEYLEINFLADNVIYIADDQLHIYYNTEYMYIKALTTYSANICGYCK